MATRKTTDSAMAPGAGVLPGSSAPTVLATPQSKTVAAKQAKITLCKDDSWSTPYWTDGDLHCLERELFG